MPRPAGRLEKRKPRADAAAVPPLAAPPGWKSDFASGPALIRLLLPAAALCVFLAGFHSLVDPDTWFHLRAGNEILRTGRFPRIDTFSFPSAGNHYIDLHWLFQVVAALVFRLAGEAGLIWFACLCTLATWACVYRLARRWAPLPIAAPLTALGIVLASERLSPRPEILSFLFFALVAWLVQRHREGWRPAAWLVPPVILLWTNTEGLFILGYLVLAAAILDHPRDRVLWRTSGLALVASLINPYLVEGALHPFVLFTRINQSLPIYSRTIGEFLPPFAEEAMHPALILFPFYLALLGAGLIWCGKWPRRGELLLLAALVYLSLTARRNVALLPVLSTPILARWFTQGSLRRVLDPYWKRRPDRLRGRAVAGICLALVLVMGWYCLGLATNRFYARAETNQRCGTSPAPVAFARGAAAFINQNQIVGPLFTSFAAGSFFTWACPQEKVFIDGRLEVHTAAHYDRYLRMLQGGPVWAQADAQYRFNAAVIQYMDAIDLVLERLRDAQVWAPVYLDDNAIVFAKRNAANAELVRREELNATRLHQMFPTWEAAADSSFSAPPVPFWLGRNLGRIHFPWSRLNLGQFFLALGRQELAIPQLLGAVREAPSLGPPRIMLASALTRFGHPEVALAVLNSARHLGGSRAARNRSLIVRGDLLAAAGRSDEAVQAYGKYLDRQREDSSSRVQIAAVFASRAQARLQAGDAKGASADITESLRLQPNNAQGYLILGSIEEALGRADAARGAYQRFVSLGGRSPQAEEALRRLGG